MLNDLRNHPFVVPLAQFRADRPPVDPEMHIKLARNFVDACTCEALAADESGDLRGAFVVAATDVLGRAGDPQSDEIRLVRFLACEERSVVASAYGGMLRMGLVRHLVGAVQLAEKSEPPEYETLTTPAWAARARIWDGLWWMGLTFEAYRPAVRRAFAHLAVVAEQAGDEYARQRWVDGFCRVSNPESTRRDYDSAMNDMIRGCAREYMIVRDGAV